MWTVIYVSQAEETAKKLLSFLRGQNFAVRLRNIGKDDTAHKGFEVLVPQPEVEAVQELIIDNDLF